MNRVAITDDVRALHRASAMQNAAMGEAVASAILVETIRQGRVTLPAQFQFARRIDSTITDADIIDLTKGTGYRDITPPAHIAAQALNKGRV